MKSLLVLVTLLSMSSAFSMGFSKIEKGDLSLTGATAEIISTKVYCPHVAGRMSCQIYGQVVNVKVALSGCADRLGGYFSKFEVIDGKGYLFLAVNNVFNEKSKLVRCVAAPFQILEISVPFEGEVQLVNLDYTGTTQPQH